MNPIQEIKPCASAYIAKVYGGTGVMIHKLMFSALGGQSLTSRYTSGYRNNSVHSIELQRQPECRVETENHFPRNCCNGAKTNVCQNTVLTNKTWLRLKWQLPTEYCRQVTGTPLDTQFALPYSLPQSSRVINSVSTSHSGRAATVNRLDLDNSRTSN